MEAPRLQPRSSPTKARGCAPKRHPHDRKLEEWLLNDLTEDIETNEQALARKDPLLARAVTPLVLAILIELVGRVVQ
jgi:hypothetical protein